MSTVPPSLREYLLAPSLKTLWAVLRDRLERNGHAIRGYVTVDLDDDGADRLSGLLGRAVRSGPARVRLADLDACLRESAAAHGLVPVVAEVTGGPLRNLPAEREAARAGRQRLWADAGRLLAEHGLADAEWVRPWTEWLRRSGFLTRLPAGRATAVLSITLQVLARVLEGSPAPAGLEESPAQRGLDTGRAPCGLDTGRAPRGLDTGRAPRGLDTGRAPRGLAELASEITGDAHGLDDGSPAAALVLRALSCALGVPPAVSAAERRDLWQRVGVSTDEVSGTVITWALRPPGRDAWSVMMRTRADLGLVTHLTVHELQRAGDLTRPGEVIHACENPQALQRLAAAGVDGPVACFSGNPAAAGMALLSRAEVRYHGDFDWPGIAIARRIFGRGARPWRFGRDDYLEAVERLAAENRLGLSGRVEPTPWDEGLRAAMTAADVAVHEEAIIDLLLAAFKG